MKTLFTFTGIAVLWATMALAQGQTAPAAPAADAGSAGGGQIEVGARGTRVSGDTARYERYRDLRSGPTLDRFRYERTHEAWAISM